MLLSQSFQAYPLILRTLTWLRYLSRPAYLLRWLLELIVLSFSLSATAGIIKIYLEGKPVPVYLDTGYYQHSPRFLKQDEETTELTTWPTMESWQSGIFNEFVKQLKKPVEEDEEETWIEDHNFFLSKSLIKNFLKAAIALDKADKDPSGEGDSNTIKKSSFDLPEVLTFTSQDGMHSSQYEGDFEISEDKIALRGLVYKKQQEKVSPSNKVTDSTKSSSSVEVAEVSLSSDLSSEVADSKKSRSLAEVLKVTPNSKVTDSTKSCPSVEVAEESLSSDLSSDLSIEATDSKKSRSLAEVLKVTPYSKVTDSTKSSSSVDVAEVSLSSEVTDSAKSSSSVGVAEVPPGSEATDNTTSSSLVGVAEVSPSSEATDSTTSSSLVGVVEVIYKRSPDNAVESINIFCPKTVFTYPDLRKIIRGATVRSISQWADGSSHLVHPLGKNLATQENVSTNLKAGKETVLLDAFNGLVLGAAGSSATYAFSHYNPLIGGLMVGVPSMLSSHFARQTTRSKAQRNAALKTVNSWLIAQSKPQTKSLEYKMRHLWLGKSEAYTHESVRQRHALPHSSWSIPGTASLRRRPIKKD